MWLSEASDLDRHRSPNKHSSYFLVSVWCIPYIASCIFFHLVLVPGWFASETSHERCFIEGLQAWPYKGTAPPISIHFLIDLFFDRLPAVCPTGFAVVLIITSAQRKWRSQFQTQMFFRNNYILYFVAVLQKCHFTYSIKRCQKYYTISRSDIDLHVSFVIMHHKRKIPIALQFCL